MYAEAGVDVGGVPVPGEPVQVPQRVPLHQQPAPPVLNLEVERVGVLLGVLDQSEVRTVAT